MLVFGALLQLIFGGYSKEEKLWDIYKACAEGKKNGGLVGGAVEKLLCSIFGTAGTYAILIGIGAILVMLITERLLFASLRKKRMQVRQERQRRAKEQDLALAAEAPEKRKAKVFTFEKAKKTEPEPVGEPIEELRLPEEPEQKPEKKFGMKKQAAAAKRFLGETVFPKEPTVPEPVKEEQTVKEEEPGVPFYEEELKNKFHREPREDKLGQLKIFRAREDFVKEETGGQEIEPSEPVSVVFGKNGRQEKEQEIDLPKAEQEPLETKDAEQPREAEKEEIVLPEIEAQEPVEEMPLPEGNTTSEVVKPENLEHTPLETEPLLPDIPKEQENKAKEEPEKIEKPAYVFPPLSLLSKPQGKETGVSDAELKATAAKLLATLESFGVKVEMKNVSCGPSVTRYELQPAMGVKVSKITSLADDIKLSLAAADIRIEAPIPGKAAVGIEVPNKENTTVMLRNLLESKEFKSHPSDIAFAVGKDIGGNTIVTDIAKMPHLLIAGATGSGKSVCINTLIMSILYKASPEDVKLIMVDPKVVELSVYNGIPHLMIPVVTDPKKASGALNWAVMEMTERYKKFADLGVRDMKGYNERVAVVAEDNDPRYQKMPQIVIIVDELADLMMVAPGEVEDAICRLAQMARAAGIHLIIATQRPSVNVITGLIKANVPSRIAFSVSSAIDSRTILDGGGAEKLLGKGDMLFFPSGYPKPVRIQGAFVSDKEVGAVVEFLSQENGGAAYNEEINSKISAVQTGTEGSGGADRDEYFIEAGRFIIEKDKASIGMLQRVYKIGFNRAARIMDQLSEAGVVGPEEGTKPRKVLMSLEEFEQYVDEYV